MVTKLLYTKQSLVSILEEELEFVRSFKITLGTFTSAIKSSQICVFINYKHKIWNHELIVNIMMIPYFFKAEAK